MKKLLFIFLLFQASFSFAQNIDVNGLYLGTSYSRQEVVAKCGEPNFVYSGRESTLPKYYDLFRGWCQYCRFKNSELKFAEEIDGTLVEFNIVDKGFVVFSEFRSGGFKCGDTISNEIIMKVFYKEWKITKPFDSQEAPDTCILEWDDGSKILFFRQNGQISGISFEARY